MHADAGRNTACIKRNPLERLFVWDALGESAAPSGAIPARGLLLTTERKIAAALTYNLRDVRCTDELIYKWRKPTDKVHDHYDMLTDQAEFPANAGTLVFSPLR